jgi:hypothetical protein
LDYDAADFYLGIRLAAPPARRPSYGVGFATTWWQQLGMAVCIMLSLSDFRLARSRSLSVGAWLPRAAPDPARA